ncbi:cytochrome c554/c'-like protein [Panacagrimonas perspica]|uniref:Cytochrome c554/c'-like protein n=2 Tax=Panacagrimonas perspica TaxID=381431 RepID=A0A4R7PCJ7_9GAMM|nr:cytochrome c554/c'-like protein [Panacagrimonas perspica]
MGVVFALLAGRAFGADARVEGGHLGVATCAGSTCHGAVKTIGTHAIRQDEYFIWQRKDAHAGAYNRLLEPRSNLMSRRLGWGDAARAEGCLTCHADTVEPAARGEKWMVTDGVGCEACHGGASKWIGSHVQGYKTRDDAKADGLYPTWEPAARGQMCLSCHQGSRERPMTHAIMAAGHPPLLFELDTFGTLEPYHHEVDADYVQRKGAQDPARAWAVGQAMAADNLLQSLAEGRHADGLMPELAFFDCDACHHSMKAGRNEPGRTAARAPGTVPLADSSVVLLGLWLQSVDPAMAKEWQAGWARLYDKGFSGDDALRREAQGLRDVLRAVVLGRVQAASLDGPQIRKVLGAILASASGAHAGDYRFAEQAAMASLVLGSALGERDGQGFSTAEKSAIDALYESVKERDRFNPPAYRAALVKLRASLAN